MRFLADESCDFAVVRALREAGHDVLAVSEYQQRSLDAEVIERAFNEGRVLLTEDKDFGWLAFVAQAKSAGVMLIRFPANLRKTLVADLARFIADHGKELPGSFVVLSPGSVRVSRRPIPTSE